MIKILFFALAAEVAAASACAALVRAGGHKARAVDATLLTKADREAADLVFTSTEAAAIVHAAYDDKPVIVVGFNPAEFLPDRMKAAEAWVRGDGDQPSFGAAPVQQVHATGEDALRQDGPTVSEYVAAGYLAANYPPSGYASRSTEEEIAAAVAAQRSGADSNADGKTTAAELRAALSAKGIAFKASASKAELQALLEAANNPA